MRINWNPLILEEHTMRMHFHYTLLAAAFCEKGTRTSAEWLSPKDCLVKNAFCAENENDNRISQCFRKHDCFRPLGVLLGMAFDAIIYMAIGPINNLFKLASETEMVSAADCSLVAGERTTQPSSLSFVNEYYWVTTWSASAECEWAGSEQMIWRQGSHIVV